MNVNDLMGLAEGAFTPSEIDVAQIEGQLGFQMPTDLVEILSDCGAGEFGNLWLFHPAIKDPHFRLPHAVFTAHAQLAEFSEFPHLPSPKCAVFGMLGGRKYLVYKVDTGWSLYDSEFDEFTEIARSLCDFIYGAYVSNLRTSSNDNLAALGRVIWGEPFPQWPFFSPSSGDKP